MLGFTGTYKGRKISVMGHGMGIPSCSIYTKELITDFGVKKIIRVGSCGAVLPHVKLRDVVIGMGAHGGIPPFKQFLFQGSFRSFFLCGGVLGHNEGEYKPEARAWQTANNTYGFSNGLGVVEVIIALLVFEVETVALDQCWSTHRYC